MTAPRRTTGGAWTAPGVGLYASAEEARQAALDVEAEARCREIEVYALPLATGPPVALGSIAGSIRRLAE